MDDLVVLSEWLFLAIDFLNKFGLLALFGKNAGQKKSHRSDTTAPQKEGLATKNILPVLVHF
jgi:hypothetical protein